MPIANNPDAIPNPYPDPDDPPLPFDPDAGLSFARRVLNWMMKEMEIKPSTDPKHAAARARDAQTLGELARTLERLDALERRKVKQRKRADASDAVELKADFVRRMDKLLAASRKNGAAGKPQPE